MNRNEKICVGSFAAIGMMFAEAVRLNSVQALADTIETVRSRFVEHPEFELRLAIAEKTVKQWKAES